MASRLACFSGREAVKGPGGSLSPTRAGNSSRPRILSRDLSQALVTDSKPLQLAPDGHSGTMSGDLVALWEPPTTPDSTCPPCWG